MATQMSEMKSDIKGGISSAGNVVSNLDNSKRKGHHKMQSMILSGVVSEQEVEAQLALLHDSSSIWANIKLKSQAGADEAWRLIQEDNKLVTEVTPDTEQGRNPEGASVFLFMLLHDCDENINLANKVLDLHPEVVTQRQTKTMYGGQSALHIAIVNRRLEFAARLIDIGVGKGVCPDILKWQARGNFFADPEMMCNFGGYPLNFAACTNQKEFVSLLLANGADLYATDETSCNNILHCVATRPGLENMYTYLHEIVMASVALAKKKNSDVATLRPLMLHENVNKDGYTPLVLAAKEGQVSMFGTILAAMTKISWAYGPVVSEMFPLWQLDSLFIQDDPNGPNRQVYPARPPSVLAVALEYQQSEILLNPRLTQLLDDKWHSYASTLFTRNLVRHFLLMSFLTLSVLLQPRTEASINPPPTDTFLQQARAVITVAAAVMIVYKGVQEIFEMVNDGVRVYFSKSGFALLENVLSLSAFGLTVLYATTFFIESEWFLFFQSTVTGLYWIYTLILLLAFRSTGPFVLMMYRMFVGDVLKFMVIYVTLLMGYATSIYMISYTALDTSGKDVSTHDFHLLSNHTGPGVEREPATDGFLTFGILVVKLFMVMLGDVEFDAFNEIIEPNYRWLSSILLLTYIVMMTIMLLNLLIAMMGNTYAVASETTHQSWHMSYAQIILSMEAQKPDSEILEFCGADPTRGYWVTVKDDLDRESQWVSVETVDHDFAEKIEKAREDAEKMEEIKALFQGGKGDAQMLASLLAKLKDFDSIVDHNGDGIRVKDEKLGPQAEFTQLLFDEK